MPDKPLQRKPVEQPAVVHEVVVPDEGRQRVLMENDDELRDMLAASDEELLSGSDDEVTLPPFLCDWFGEWRQDQTIVVRDSSPLCYPGPWRSRRLGSWTNSKVRMHKRHTTKMWEQVRGINGSCGGKRGMIART